MALNLVQLYINVLTKALVSVAGSPTSIPPMFYGDQVTLAIYPVIPASTITGNPLGNAGQAFQTMSLAGYTMNITMAGTPNAQTPPTSFASLGAIAFNTPATGFGFFAGSLDLTQVAVQTFIGNNAAQTAYINLDVADANLKRATLLQTTFQLNASIDVVTPGIPTNPIIYLTAAQIRNLFVPKAGAAGESFTLQSEDGTKKAQVYLGDDGALKTPNVT